MIKLSRYLQILLLLAFLLPFFPKGCLQPSQDDLNAKIDADSTRVSDSTAFIDSLKLINPKINIDSAYNAHIAYPIKIDSNKKIEPIAVDSVSKTISTVEKQEKNDKSDFATELSEKSRILKLLLRPNDNYTGLAHVLNTFFYIFNYAGITIAFIVWIIALILKLKEKKSFHLFNITGLISFYFTSFVYTFTYIDIKLWGYWLTFALGLLIIILDSIIFLVNKNKTIKAEIDETDEN